MVLSKSLKINDNYSVLNAVYIEDFIKADPYGVFYNTIFNSNNKLGGIAALNFETALRCSSKARKYCELCKQCYAIGDANKYSIHHMNTISTAAIIEVVQSNKKLFELLNNFLKVMEVKIIRYNIVGDFKNADNIIFLKKLCLLNPNIKIYGYSKRLDLIELLKDILKDCSNFYIGCSKKLYKALKPYGANFFNTVNSVKKFIEADNMCKGSCPGCGKCYSLKGAEVVCFIHGSPTSIQKTINTLANNEYLTGYINAKLNIDIKDPKKGFFINKYNKILEAEGLQVPFKTNKKGQKIYLNNNLSSFIKWLNYTAIIRGVKNE